MNKQPKVLICTTTSNHKDYVVDKWIDYVRRFTYTNVDILIVDNSVDAKYHEKIVKKGIKCLHIQPEEKEMLQWVMAKSDEILRNYTLIEGFDYMLKVEVDIFPPLNVIEALLSHNKDVIAGLYFINSKNDIKLMINQLEDELFLGHGDTTETQDAIYYSLSYAFNWTDGTVKQVYHAGNGCILISKKVLECIHFRIIPDDVITFADSIFAFDCYSNDIPFFVDTSIFCQHLNSDWTRIKLSYDLSNKRLTPEELRGKVIQLNK